MEISLCCPKFPCVVPKFPAFSLSGKSDNQIPCFPCAVATLSLTLRVTLPCFIRKYCLVSDAIFAPWITHMPLKLNVSNADAMIFLKKKKKKKTALDMFSYAVSLQIFKPITRLHIIRRGFFKKNLVALGRNVQLHS